MPTLTSSAALVLVVYFAAVVLVGYVLRRSMKTAKDFLEAGRSLPAWTCGLAFLSAGLGAPEVIGMGAWGARYGLQSALLVSTGVLCAMVFLGLFMMPLYYGSRARTVPEFVGLRFEDVYKRQVVGMRSCISSQAVSRAPCRKGRVSSANTWMRLPCSTAERITPSAVP